MLFSAIKRTFEGLPLHASCFLFFAVTLAEDLGFRRKELALQPLLPMTRFLREKVRSDEATPTQRIRIPPPGSGRRISVQVGKAWMGSVTSMTSRDHGSFIRISVGSTEQAMEPIRFGCIFPTTAYSQKISPFLLTMNG